MNITKIIIACILWIVLGQRPTNSTPITSIDRSIPGELTVWMSSTDVFVEPTPYSILIPLFDAGETVAFTLNRTDPAIAEITVKWTIGGDVAAEDTFLWVQNFYILEFDGVWWNDIGAHRSVTYNDHSQGAGGSVGDSGSALVLLGLAFVGAAAISCKPRSSPVTTVNSKSL